MVKRSEDFRKSEVELGGDGNMSWQDPGRVLSGERTGDGLCRGLDET
jgi:hypothetical protein